MAEQGGSGLRIAEKLAGAFLGISGRKSLSCLDEKDQRHNCTLTHSLVTMVVSVTLARVRP